MNTVYISGSYISVNIDVFAGECEVRHNVPNEALYRLCRQYVCRRYVPVRALSMPVWGTCTISNMTVI